MNDTMLRETIAETLRFLQRAQELERAKELERLSRLGAGAPIAENLRFLQRARELKRLSRLGAGAPIAARLPVAGVKRAALDLRWILNKLRREL